MKASAVSWSLVLMLVVPIGLSGCGGSTGNKPNGAESTSAPAASRVELTETDIPDVLMPGVWSGIQSAYRERDKVTIRTDWPDTLQRRSDAGGAALAAAGDLGYVYSVTVYGDTGETLGWWEPR